LSNVEIALRINFLISVMFRFDLLVCVYIRVSIGVNFDIRIGVDIDLSIRVCVHVSVMVRPFTSECAEELHADKQQSERKRQNEEQVPPLQQFGQ
jgi:cell division GTPase FtsZ